MRSLTALAAVSFLAALASGAEAQKLTRGNPLSLVPAERSGPRVVVLGAAVDEAKIPAGVRRRMANLGRVVAQRGGVLITGASPGYPQIAARAAHQAGGLTIGVSPARSAKDHTGHFKMPTAGFDIMQLTGHGPGMGFIEREAPLIQHGDILVYANGRSGTLGELVAGMHEAKVIALLDGSGGVAGQARARILPFIGDGHATIVSDSNPRRLMDKAQRALADLRAHPEAAPIAVVPRTMPPMQRGRGLGGRAAGRDVFAFFGHGDGLTTTDRANVDRLVDLIGARAAKPILVVPTRTGLTSEIALRARAGGVETVGVSPARSRAEHLRNGFATEGLSRIRLTGRGPGVGEFAANRSIVENAQVVFVAGGDYKTLGGMVFAAYHPTVVGVLETAGGMSGKLRSDILATFDKKPHATVIFDTDPNRLYERSAREAARQQSTAKLQYIAAE